jgi:hypothetical protein
LTPNQVVLICNHQECGAKLGIDYAKSDPWEITIKKGVLSGYTTMDNFDMADFLVRIGVPDKAVIWDSDNCPSDRDMDEINECDPNMCEKCHMRFWCFTHRDDKEDRIEIDKGMGKIILRGHK